MSSDLQRGAFGGVDAADRAADALRRLEHGRRVHQRFDVAGVRVLEALGQGRQHRLADRQIAGAGDRHDALARLGEDVQLAKGRDVVEAGIGAGVRDHDQSVPHQHSAAIGHSRIPERTRRRELLANFAGRSNPIRALPRHSGALVKRATLECVDSAVALRKSTGYTTFRRILGRGRRVTRTFDALWPDPGRTISGRPGCASRAPCLDSSNRGAPPRQAGAVERPGTAATAHRVHTRWPPGRQPCPVGSRQDWLWRPAWSTLTATDSVSMPPP